jgi:hypothetical protein
MRSRASTSCGWRTTARSSSPGCAAPGANVTLLLDGEAIASDAANDVGAWLLMPDAPLPPGSHQLMVQARDAGLGRKPAGRSRCGARARRRPAAVALSEPSQPPEAEEDDEAAEEQIAASLSPHWKWRRPARLEAEELPVDDAEEEQVALAPVQEPDVEVAAPVPQQPEPPAREAEADEHAAVSPEPEVDPEPNPRSSPPGGTGA